MLGERDRDRPGDIMRSSYVVVEVRNVRQGHRLLLTIGLRNHEAAMMQAKMRAEARWRAFGVPVFEMTARVVESHGLHRGDIVLSDDESNAEPTGTEGE